jgi:hypothetical protein
MLILWGRVGGPAGLELRKDKLTWKWLKLLRLDSREATQSTEELGNTFSSTRQHSDLKRDSPQWCSG